MGVVEKTFEVQGMTCASCAVSLESFLSSQKGVEKVRVNYANLSANILFDEQLSESDLNAFAKQIGYSFILDNQKSVKATEDLRKKLLFSSLFTIPLFIISMFLMGLLPYENYIQLGLSIPVLIFSGKSFFINAIKKARHGIANMDTLVALSTGTAFIYSTYITLFHHHGHVYFESAVVIITLILLGKFLEERAKEKTNSAINGLLSLQTNDAKIIRNGEEITLPLAEIIIGDLVIIKPGERIPVDGKVKKGESYVDESMITGEPLAVLKEKRSLVYAGTINQKGTLQVLVQKASHESLLSKIIRLVQNAQNDKPPIQLLADKISAVFVPIVCVIAITAFGVWYGLGPEPTLENSIKALVTVLIIACPCALGLATPTALMVGIGKAADHGILIKSAEALEIAKDIDILILDKTGTITKGKPQVLASHFMDESILPILVAIEKQSEHPLASAITTHFSSQEATTLDSFKSLTGKGVQATHQNATYFVGNIALMKEQNIDIGNYQSELQNYLSAAYTTILIANEKEVLGIVGIADEIKDTSKKAISIAQSFGIEVRMLTGDNNEVAASIAKQVGITNFQSGVKPDEKGAIVKQLQEQGKTVAMVGDGINDSHALAQANLSIAMGGGSDIAMEAADTTFIQNDLMHISMLIEVSKQTSSTIKQNLFWAFIYNIIGIPLAAGVLYPVNGFLLNPMIAGGAMALSSVSVVMNSLRLKQKDI